MVSELAGRANLPVPKIFVIANDTPNAFATGRNPEHAVVAVTEGLMRLLSPEEVRGVVAHELSHVKNRDILIGSIAATMAGAIMMLANFCAFLQPFSAVTGIMTRGRHGRRRHDLHVHTGPHRRRIDSDGCVALPGIPG